MTQKNLNNVLANKIKRQMENYYSKYSNYIYTIYRYTCAKRKFKMKK